MDRVSALGFFDGVHRGHGALLERAVLRARELDASACAMTLNRQPGSLLTGRPAELICTLDERRRLMREDYGLDEVIVARFDAAMRSTPWDVFLTRGLAEKLQARHVICGHNYRFGARGEGTPEKLKAWCAANGVGCDVIDEVCMDGAPVSSTRIRACLTEGNTEQANRLLGHPYSLTGTVTNGQHLGRRLGIPTANFPMPEGLLVPARGVYAARVRVGDRWFDAVANLGTRPTVQGEGILIESWLLDFSGDLYGQEIRVEFYTHLRPERKFPSVEAMKQEILRNAEQTREYFKIHSKI